MLIEDNTCNMISDKKNPGFDYDAVSITFTEYWYSVYDISEAEQSMCTPAD